MADYEAEPLEAVLRRLKEERDEADARYNDALTAVDKALSPSAAIPPPPPPLDDHQIAALNEAWNTLPAPPRASGLRQRATGFIWGVIGPYLQRQLTFNSLLVDHINRNAAAAREAHRTAAQTADALRDQLAALAQFQSRLIQFFQQITAYVGHEGSRHGRQSARAQRVAQWSRRQRREAMGVDVGKRAARRLPGRQLDGRAR